MRKFIAGAALGLAAGLVIGVGGSSLLGIDTAARNGAPTEGDPVRAASSTQAPPTDFRGFVEPSTRRRDTRPPRRRVERPEPVTRKPSAKPDPPPTAARRTTADLLAAMEEFLRDGTVMDGRATSVAVELARRPDARPIAFDLVTRALAKSETQDDRAFWIAFTLASAVSPEDATRALRAGLAGDARLLRLSVALAQAAVRALEQDLTSLTAELLGNSVASARGAGIYLSHSAEAPPIQALLRIAGTDANDDVRAGALRVLTEFASDDDRPGVREIVTPLILMNARNGPAQARREAIESFEEIGVAAADTALALLREGALDEDLAWYVVRPLLDAGRIGDVMATELTWEVADAVISWVSEEGDEDDLEPAGSRVAACAPHAEQLASTCGADSVSDFASTLIEFGHLDVAERIARLTSLPRHHQRVVLDAMFGNDVAPEALRVDLASRAIKVFAAYLDPRTSSVPRRRTAIELAEDAYLGYERMRAGVLAVLDNAARGDPNSWIRALAAEAAQDLRDTYE